MSHIFIMENVSAATPGVTTFRGWTASEETAKAYNENFMDGDNTVKMVIRPYADPDLTGVPERDANDNEI